jgi:hypothetical protein
MRWEDIDEKLLVIAGALSVIAAFITVYLVIKGVNVIEN